MPVTNRYWLVAINPLSGVITQQGGYYRRWWKLCWDLNEACWVKFAKFSRVCGLIFKFPPAFLKPAAVAARWPALRPTGNQSRPILRPLMNIIPSAASLLWCHFSHCPITKKNGEGLHMVGKAAARDTIYWLSTVTGDNRVGNILKVQHVIILIDFVYTTGPWKESGGIITAHKHTVLFFGDGKEASIITTYFVKGFHFYPYQALFVIFGGDPEMFCQPDRIGISVTPVLQFNHWSHSLDSEE